MSGDADARDAWWRPAPALAGANVRPNLLFLVRCAARVGEEGLTCENTRSPAAATHAPPASFFSTPPPPRPPRATHTMATMEAAAVTTADNEVSHPMDEQAGPFPVEKLQVRVLPQCEGSI